MARNLSEDFDNPDLFEEYQAGKYEYGELPSGNGKYATGSLKLDDDPSRDPTAQAQAGGNRRRGADNDWGADDGGHLIAARFGGGTGEENLTAQNRNLNRGQYKRMENEWADHLENGDKVFVHIETDGEDRPEAYMGYVIYEDAGGHRSVDGFHYINESQQTIAGIEAESEAYMAEHPEVYEDWQESETSYLGDVDADDKMVEARYEAKLEQQAENAQTDDAEGKRFQSEDMQ